MNKQIRIVAQISLNIPLPRTLPHKNRNYHLQQKHFGSHTTKACLSGVCTYAVFSKQGAFADR